MYRPKVYTASKIRHKRLWLDLSNDYADKIECTARWIRQPDTPDLSDTKFWIELQRRRLWMQNIQDVQRSDCLVAYDAHSDDVRGTLVEVGVALGLGKTVFAVGFSDHHSWKWHPLVQIFPGLDETFDYIAGILS